MKSFVYSVFLLLFTIVVAVVVSSCKKPIALTKQEKLVIGDEYSEWFKYPIGLDILYMNANDIVQIYGTPLRERKIEFENKYMPMNNFKDNRRVLVYKDIDITFYNNYIETIVLKRKTNKDSLINIGSSKEELEEVLGVTITSDVYTLFDNRYDSVSFYFDRGVVSKIIWDYPID
ncbi:hypothetical protein NO1_1139 [Candidatus Termititenax aidoneus]|uniref:Lipoprotein n=1 Tax=Termititenax aidoneus TaxID=2218524 RepID=A0A388TAX7_TERA1|nr:hypothetical protein NO1_1139 [Candidatus Termititenax aidoneus]